MWDVICIVVLETMPSNTCISTVVKYHGGAFNHKFRCPFIMPQCICTVSAYGSVSMCQGVYVVSIISVSVHPFGIKMVVFVYFSSNTLVNNLHPLKMTRYVVFCLVTIPNYARARGKCELDFSLTGNSATPKHRVLWRTQDSIRGELPEKIFGKPHL